MRICTSCGKQNDDSAKFCKWCGKPVGEIIKTDSVAPTSEKKIKITYSNDKLQATDNTTTAVKTSTSEPAAPKWNPVSEPKPVYNPVNKPINKPVRRENECPSCGAEIFKWDNYCGHCGSKLTPTEKRPVVKKKVNKKLIIGLVAVIAVTAGGFGAKYIYKTIQKSNSHYLAKFRDQYGKWGYMDENGNVIIECKYDEAEDFADSGYAVVGIKDEYSDYDVRYGKIDTKGKEIVPCEYTYVSEGMSDSGFCSIERYDSWDETYYSGIAQKDGTIYLNTDFHSIYNIADSGYFIASTPSSDYGIIDSSYNWVVSPQYSGLDILRDENNEPIKVNGEYCVIATVNYESTGLIDVNGNTLLSFDYDFIDTSCYKETIKLREKSGKMGVMNASLDMIHACQYDQISFFSTNGVAIAQKDDTAYFIYSNGDVVELGTDIDGYCFEDSLFSINYNDKIGVATDEGEWIIQPEYDYINIGKNFITAENYEPSEDFLFDRDGRLLSSGYETYYMYDNPVGAVSVYNGSYYGAIDRNGNQITDCTYDNERMTDGWINLFDDSGSRGVLINPEGEIVSSSYTRYFVDKDSEYITAWPENDWNDYSSDLYVKGVILEVSGNLKKEITGDYFNIGKFVKVR